MSRDPPAAAGDRASFIRANTRVLSAPHVPEIRLHLADEAIDLRQRTEDDLARIGLPPPFWAFAWAGGQALARYLLDHPETVAGRRVLDFAAGTGIGAIAALRSGAKTCVATEIDPFAIEAIALNAALNDVSVEIRSVDALDADRDAGLGRFDVVLAGDVFYERALAERTMAFVRRYRERGAAVLIGDPGRSYLPKFELEPIASYAVPVTRALEDAEIKQTTVWRLRD